MDRFSIYHILLNIGVILSIRSIRTQNVEKYWINIEKLVYLRLNFRICINVRVSFFSDRIWLLNENLNKDKKKTYFSRKHFVKWGNLIKANARMLCCKTETESKVLNFQTILILEAFLNIYQVSWKV